MGIAPRFGIDDGRMAEEAEFVWALHRPAESGDWYADAWPREHCLTLTVCPSDQETNGILRTLRIDFFGDRVLVGEDETQQLATELDVGRSGVYSMVGASPDALAEYAADWLELELSRPIDRQEWETPAFRHWRWVLADTGDVIVVSDSRNQPRTELGPPDRTVRVHGRRNSG